MTTKERVLAYFTEWADKGVNPANEISAIISNHGMACMNWHGESAFSFPLESGTELAFMRAARILRIDNPWIACSERKPSDGETVLALYNGRGDCDWDDTSDWPYDKKVKVVKYKGGAFEMWDVHDWPCTHWQPLPAKP